MASIIDFHSNRSLQFSGSECLYRSIEVPSGTVDLRFGTLIHANVVQSFSTTVSQYECVRMLFTTGTPGPVPTDRFIGVGTNVGAGCAFINDTTNSRWVLGINVPTNAANANTNWFAVSNDVTMSNVTSVTLKIPNHNYTTTSSCGFMMSRIYKSNTNLILECRYYNSYLPIASWTDSFFRTLMTDLNQTYMACSATSSNADIMDEINGVLFTWPFFNSPGTIPSIGYRAITA